MLLVVDPVVVADASNWLVDVTDVTDEMIEDERDVATEEVLVEGALMLLRSERRLEARPDIMKGIDEIPERGLMLGKRRRPFASRRYTMTGYTMK